MYGIYLKITLRYYRLEVDRMSKFTYLWMQIRMRIPEHEPRRMRINMRMTVQEDPRKLILVPIPVPRYPWMRMQIFVVFLINTNYYYRIQTITVWRTSYEATTWWIRKDR